MKKEEEAARMDSQRSSEDARTAPANEASRSHTPQCASRYCTEPTCRELRCLHGHPRCDCKPAAGAWQPIETAPKGERVLCAWPSGKDYEIGTATWAINGDDDGWFDEDGGHWLDRAGNECCPPTHWQPQSDAGVANYQPSDPAVVTQGADHHEPTTREAQSCSSCADLTSQLTASTARVQRPEAALRLAKQATNGWACYARTKREHDEIARLHREIKELELQQL